MTKAADAVTLEVRGEQREIRELPSETIHAVDDDPMDVAVLDAPKQLREPGALEGRAALAPIVEAPIRIVTIYIRDQ